MNDIQSRSELLPRWLYFLSLTLILVGIGSRMTVIGLSRYLNQSAENSAISGILDVSEGKNLFPDKTVVPFRLYTYMPLQAWIVGNLLSPLKESSTMTRVYLIRLSSLLFFAALLFIYWKFYVKENGIKLTPFILAFSLGLTEFGNYALSGRNDFLALFMEIIAGAFFIEWIKQKSFSRLIGYLLFCGLALFTRQNSIGMLLSGFLYLLLHRKFREFILSAIFFLALVLTSFFLINHYTPLLWIHAFKAHVGVWRPFYWSHPSTLIFLVCYSLFIFLGIRNCLRKDADSKILFLKIVILVTAILSFTLIHRHGAWLNYFFETLLMLSFFSVRELIALSLLPNDSFPKRLITFLIPIVAIIIFSATFYKAKKQYTSLAFLEFVEGAKKIKELAPQGGVSLGAWAQGLGVHLRDWEMIGPEILNGSHYAEANYSNFSWVYDRIAEKISSANPPVLLYVNPGCERNKIAAPLISDPHLLKLMSHYQLTNVIYPWLCLYRNPNPS